MQIIFNGPLPGLTSATMPDPVQAASGPEDSDVAAFFSLDSTTQVRSDPQSVETDDQRHGLTTNEDVRVDAVGWQTSSTVRQNLPFRGAPVGHGPFSSNGDASAQSRPFGLALGTVLEEHPSRSSPAQDGIHPVLNRPVIIGAEGRPSERSFALRDLSVSPEPTKTETNTGRPAATGLSASAANLPAQRNDIAGPPDHAPFPPVENAGVSADDLAVPIGRTSSAPESRASAPGLLIASAARETQFSPRTEPAPPPHARGPAEEPETKITPPAPPEANAKMQGFHPAAAGGVRDIVVAARAAGAPVPKSEPFGAAMKAVVANESGKTTGPTEKGDGSAVEPADEATPANDPRPARQELPRPANAGSGRPDSSPATLPRIQVSPVIADTDVSPTELPDERILSEASIPDPQVDTAIQGVDSRRKATGPVELAVTQPPRAERSSDRSDSGAAADTEGAHRPARRSSDAAAQTSAVYSALPAVAPFAGPVQASTVLSGKAAPTLDEQIDTASMPPSGSPDVSRRTPETDLRVPLHVARSVVAQMAESIRTPGDGSVEVRLSPEELGRVRVTMSPGEHGLVVQLVAERPETLDLLRRHIDLLQADLRDAGYSGLEFSFGQEGRQQPQARDAAAIPPGKVTSETSTLSRPAPDPTRAPIGNGALDIRL